MDLFAGQTSQLTEVFIGDNSVVTGAGLTGLVYDSAGLTAYYYRSGAATATAISLATMTVGTWVSGGFKEVDATNCPGLYQVGLPNAMIATGVKMVTLFLKGATNMVMTPLRIYLKAHDPYATRKLKRNTDFTNLHFVMIDSTTHLPVAGKTVTPTRLIDGGAFGTGGLTNIVDKTAGVYTVDGVAADMNGENVTLKMTATGCDPTIFTIITEP